MTNLEMIRKILKDNNGNMNTPRLNRNAKLFNGETSIEWEAEKKADAKAKREYINQISI